jgi:hypothetical protein
MTIDAAPPMIAPEDSRRPDVIVVGAGVIHLNT